MSSTDPISDMLARIRNASLAKHAKTTMPLSKIKVSVAELLRDAGYVSSFRVSEEGFGELTVVLKYEGKDRAPAIAGIRRMSTPGRRMYVGYDDIPKVYNGLGVAILSTSQGLMTDKQARAKKVGGELLCEVW